MKSRSVILLLYYTHFLRIFNKNREISIKNAKYYSKLFLRLEITPSKFCCKQQNDRALSQELFKCLSFAEVFCLIFTDNRNIRCCIPNKNCRKTSNKVDISTKNAYLAQKENRKSQLILKRCKKRLTP